MELKQQCLSIMKIAHINSELLNKLGEIILLINNNSSDVSLKSKDLINCVCHLHNFWCHKQYLSYIKNIKNKPESNLYDNCMNLILVISSKVSKNSIAASQMTKKFLEHISTHYDCFNYIISMYRLFSTSETIKKSASDLLLFKELFICYKKLYTSNIQYEIESIKNTDTINYLPMKNDIYQPTPVETIDNLNSDTLKNDFYQSNAIETLKSLSFQLGESCLTANLGEIISLKREMEIENIIKPDLSIKNVDIDYLKKLRNNNFVYYSQRYLRKRTSSCNGVFSLAYATFTGSQKNLTENLERKETNKEREISPKKTLNNDKSLIYKLALNFDNKESLVLTDKHIDNDKKFRSCMKLREVLANFIYNCISDCSYNKLLELELVSYTSLIADYLMLPSTQKQIRKNRYKTLEKFSHQEETIYNKNNFLLNSSMSNMFKTNKYQFYRKIKVLSLIGTSLINPPIENNLSTTNLKNSILLNKDELNNSTIIDIGITLLEEDNKTKNVMTLTAEYKCLFSILSLITYSISTITSSFPLLKELYVKPELKLSNIWINQLIYQDIIKNLSTYKINSSETFIDSICDRLNKIFSIFPFQNKQNYNSILSSSIIIESITSSIKVITEYLNNHNNNLHINSYTSQKYFVYKHFEVLINIKSLLIHFFLFNIKFLVVIGPANNLIYDSSSYAILSNNQMIKSEKRESSDYNQNLTGNSGSNTGFRFKNNFTTGNKNIIDNSQKYDTNYNSLANLNLYPEIVDLTTRFSELLGLLINIDISKPSLTDNNVSDSESKSNTGKLLNQCILNSTELMSIIKGVFTYLFINKELAKQPIFERITETERNNTNKENINVINFISVHEEILKSTNFQLNQNSKAYQELRLTIDQIIRISSFYCSVLEFYNYKLNKNKVQAEAEIVGAEVKESKKAFMTSDYEYKFHNYKEISYIREKNYKFWMSQLLNFFTNINSLFKPFTFLYEYIISNGSYIRNDNKTNNIKTSQIISTMNNICLLNYTLISSLLQLQESIFDLSKYSDVIVNPNTALHYLRLHYMQFVRLYNKKISFSIKFKLNEIDFNSTNDFKSKAIKSLLKDVSNDQLYIQIVIGYSRLHMKCLLKLSMIKTDYISKKFKQLGVGEFFFREINLESDIVERQFKYKSVFSQVKEKNKAKTNKKNGYTVNITQPVEKKVENTINIIDEEDDSLDNINLVNPSLMHLVNKNKSSDVVNKIPTLCFDKHKLSSDQESNNFNSSRVEVNKENNDKQEDAVHENDENNNSQNLEEVTLTNRTENLMDESQLDAELEEYEDFDLVMPNELMNKPKFTLNLATYEQKNTQSITVVEKKNEKVKDKDVVNLINQNNQLKQQEDKTLKPTHIINKKSFSSQNQIFINDLSQEINNKNLFKSIEAYSNRQDNSKLNLSDQKNQNNIKIQIALERLLRKKYRLVYDKQSTELLEKDINNINTFYFKERQERLIYLDSELHCLILGFVISLLLDSKGTLEDMYCSSQPYLNNQTNILYILHQHLNHSENLSILPQLSSVLDESGKRLLKVLSKKLFNPSFYKDWTFIAEGSYGVVYSVVNPIEDPKYLAIKKIPLGGNILDKCPLFDIYSEITALENLRMEGCVVKLYDYGVDDTSYYIVMKKYNCSLKQWRNIIEAKSIEIIKNQGSLCKKENIFNSLLPLYLTIFKEIIQSVEQIHKNKITHYDLKCDNVLIEYITDPGKSNNEENEHITLNDLVKVKICDFGECWLFSNNHNEYNMLPKGTDVCKSPEMLLSSFDNQIEEEENFLIRKAEQGTTRASDIWSLGCMFYELLTGNFLFEDEINDSYFGFIDKIKSLGIDDLINTNKRESLHSNFYLIDFLKYMLVKDPYQRPSILEVKNRFQHVYAIIASEFKISSINDDNQNVFIKDIWKSIYVEDISLLGSNCDLNVNYIKHSLETSIEILLVKISNKLYSVKENDKEYTINNPNTNYNSQLLTNSKDNKYIPSLIKLTKDIFLAEIYYFETNIPIILDLGVTHIISWSALISKDLNNNCFVLNILENLEFDNHEIDSYPNNQLLFYSLVFKVLDFLRHAKVYNGTCLFIDDFSLNENTSILIDKKIRRLLPIYFIRPIILTILSIFTKMSIYDCLTYVNSKNLFIEIPDDCLPHLTPFNKMVQNLNYYIYKLPVLRCHCGGCLIILKKKKLLKYDSHDYYSCTCNGLEKFESSCASNNCSEYIRYMKENYKQEYKSLQWANVSDSELILGFKDDSAIVNNNLHKKIISLSSGNEENLVVHSFKEKTNRVYTRKTSININNFNQDNNEGTVFDSYNVIDVITLYKCKICQVWMFGEKKGIKGNIEGQLSNNSDLFKEYYILMNNLYNTKYNNKQLEADYLLKTNQLNELGLLDIFI